MQLTASPVKQLALQYGLPVLQPTTLKTEEAQQSIAHMGADVMVVAAYGLILPKAVLQIPRLGCLNIHASLLPRWRGAAPIQRAILAGDTETGVDLMQMEAGLDTGPILIERRTPIALDDSAGSLQERLAALGADALAEGLARVARGETLPARAQSTSGVEYAHKIDKSEARLDWRDSARALERKVRAFNPWPVAETELCGERLRIWSAEAIDAVSNAEPGTIIEGRRDALDVATGEGILRILELQREGGRRTHVRDWLNARRDSRSRA